VDIVPPLFLGYGKMTQPINVNWKLIWDLLILVMLKLFSNKWHLLTISLRPFKIFGIC